MPAAEPAQPAPLIPPLDHADRETAVRRSECRNSCAVDEATQWHHAKLTSVEGDRDALLELFELALTWHELEYSELPMIPPDHWMDFVQDHRWGDAALVERIFGVATDVARTATRAARRRPGAPARHCWQVTGLMATENAAIPEASDDGGDAHPVRSRAAG